MPTYTDRAALRRKQAEDINNNSDFIPVPSATDVEYAYNLNVEIVSQADAEAGASTASKRWSPQRVSQAIIALGSGGSPHSHPVSDITNYDESPLPTLIFENALI